MRSRVWVICLAALLSLAALPRPAEAAVPRMPVRCGMVVTGDAYLVLDRYLYCPTGFGIAVRYAGDGFPHVTVDLQGHTLRGPGTGSGITSFNDPNYAWLTVVNGRVENWETGVGGDFDTRITGVKLVGNTTGFWCNGSCSAESSYFRSRGEGLIVGGEAHARVRHSTFSRNRLGIDLRGFLSSIDVQRNSFVRNEVGVTMACMTWGTVAHNGFLDNGTDVRQQPCS